MMAPGKEIRPALLLLSLLFLLYIASRFCGGALLDNHWSFLHWQFIPSWYLFLCFAVLVAFTAAGVRYHQWPLRLVSSGRYVAVALGGLFLLTIAISRHYPLNAGRHRQILEQIRDKSPDNG